jgi:hypothetical protein
MSNEAKHSPAMLERAERARVEWRDRGDGYWSGSGSYMFPLAYVALPSDHPDVDKHYDEVSTGDTDYGPQVNGGLTFNEGNVFGWDYGHAYNDFDMTGDIDRALAFFRARAAAGAP